MHSAQLSDELIRAFATLPTGMASKRAIGLVMRGHISPGDLATFGWTLSRIKQLKDQEAYERVLASTDPLTAVVQLLLEAAFPAPPWPGTDLLKPVTTRAALHRIGVELKNCLETPQWLARSVLKALNGTDYFYEWRGEQRALLQFVRLLDVGWYLEQIEGFDGRGVSETTQKQIIETCSGAPVMCACEPTGFDSAFREKLLGAMA
jgi:hypothetical protein